jgi:hemerythrin
MPIQWTQDLATSVPDIDRQHQEIFQRLHLLVEAMRQGAGKSEVSGLIDFLGTYVAEHFALEERYMQSSGYPDLAAHRAEHQAFARDFEHVKAEHDQTGPSTSLVLALNQSVAGWLRTHIARTDRALGAYWIARRRPQGP